MDEGTKGEDEETHTHLLQQYQHARSNKPSQGLVDEEQRKRRLCGCPGRMGDEGWSDIAHNINTTHIMYASKERGGGGWPCFVFFLHQCGQSSRLLFLSLFFISILLFVYKLWSALFSLSFLLFLLLPSLLPPPHSILPPSHSSNI